MARCSASLIFKLSHTNIWLQGFSFKTNYNSCYICHLTIGHKFTKKSLADGFAVISIGWIYTQWELPPSHLGFPLVSLCELWVSLDPLLGLLPWNLLRFLMFYAGAVNLTSSSSSLADLVRQLRILKRELVKRLLSYIKKWKHSYRES